MNAKISKKAELTEAEWDELRNYRVTGGVDALTAKSVSVLESKHAKYNVALWDFGAKRNIARELQKRGCRVTVVPATATADEILAQTPDGIMLTNGPGDPAENTRIIAELKRLCTHRIPTFGICLGHQLLALSQGAETMKLHYGHRGANQPVLETDTGRVFVTSQNHGYAVVTESLPETAVSNYVNCNDGSCEGVTYCNMPVFSVQFHPEASAGPLDSSWLFDKFIDAMEKGKQHATE
jgi:carbamoyl-phosphate synthase small subunit